MRLLLAALMTVSLALAPSAAEAKGAPGCITKKEFRRIAPGMSDAQVRALAGAKGRVVTSSSLPNGDARTTLKFKQCGKPWRLSVMYVEFEYSESTVQVPFCDGGSCGYFPETHYSAPFVVVGGRHSGPSPAP